MRLIVFRFVFNISLIPFSIEFKNRPYGYKTTTKMDHVLSLVNLKLYSKHDDYLKVYSAW